MISRGWAFRMNCWFRIIERNIVCLPKCGEKNCAFACIIFFLVQRRYLFFCGRFLHLNRENILSEWDEYVKCGHITSGFTKLNKETLCFFVGVTKLQSFAELLLQIKWVKDCVIYIYIYLLFEFSSGVIAFLVVPLISLK